MGTDTVVAYYLGGVVASVCLLIFAFLSLFPRKDRGHVIAMVLVVAALVQAMSEWQFILDLGYKLRLDSINFNWARFLSAAVSLFFQGLASGIYLWHHFIPGWAMAAFFGVSHLLLMFAGNTAYNAHWPMFSIGALMVGIAAYMLMFKGYFTNGELSTMAGRGRGSRLLAYVYIGGFLLSIVLLDLVLFLSDAFLSVHGMTSATREWLYFAANAIRVGVTLIPAVNYYPFPESTKQA